MPERTFNGIPFTVGELTQCAKERRGLVGTESDVHMWYGAMWNFTRGVTTVVHKAQVSLMNQPAVDRVMREAADLPRC